MKITLKDGSVKEYSEAKSVYEIAKDISEGLARMLVVGQQEETDGTVSVRSRFAGDEGVKPLSEFISQICEEIRTKAIRKEVKAEEETK